jgi:hypothetical protein
VPELGVQLKTKKGKFIERYIRGPEEKEPWWREKLAGLDYDPIASLIEDCE